MSLINKMLKDLDARGTQPGEVMQPSIRSVTRPGRQVSVPVVAGGALIAFALAAATVFGWRYYQQRPAPVAAAVKPAAPVVQVSAPVPVPVQVVPAPPPVAEEPERAPVVTKAQAPRARQAAVKPPAKVAAQPDQAPPVSTPQRAESEYRRALASLQEGRVSDAAAGFERAVQIDPRHEGARQTLVGLLIESNRRDDALRVLEAGLVQDPRQPAMAMLLARLQIERGASGIETLMRTLPHAAGNAGYHAFLAGALQRAERHREAAEQYQAALRLAPENGVWWMGLGISLQAEKRTAQALEAYQRAASAPGLTPQLQAFVERKLQQLNR
jgi:MSHA biogenesis protein MshN